MSVTHVLEESIAATRDTQCGLIIKGGAYYSVIDVSRLQCDNCKARLAALVLAAQDYA